MLLKFDHCLNLLLADYSKHGRAGITTIMMIGTLAVPYHKVGTRQRQIKSKKYQNIIIRLYLFYGGRWGICPWCSLLQASLSGQVSVKVGTRQVKVGTRQRQIKSKKYQNIIIRLYLFYGGRWGICPWCSLLQASLSMIRVPFMSTSVS